MLYKKRFDDDVRKGERSMRAFNTEGLCIPEEDYMVDISGKIKQITKLIDNKKYFTINRARQYGKTTTLAALYRELKDKYIMLFLSFEGVGNKAFESDKDFVLQFINMVREYDEYAGFPKEAMAEWGDLSWIRDETVGDYFALLSKKITSLCKKCGKDIVLMIDEVDKSSDNQIFLNFLGVLRNKFLKRKIGQDVTFRSVILAGVYDIKNLKQKIIADSGLKQEKFEQKKYNSPWNIAADFNVDMSFSQSEIGQMLSDYENDHETGMDIGLVSEKIHYYTKGYPFLVSWICKKIDEEIREWKVESVEKAVKDFAAVNCTLTDDLIKNYENNLELKDFIDSILMQGAEKKFVLTDTVINIGHVLGIFRNEKDNVCISNIVFEKILYNHVLSNKERSGSNDFTLEKSQFINAGGKLNICLVLDKFQELMYTEYRARDERFLENQCRLLFLCFIKPIINGTGDYFVETQTRNNSRMDVVISYAGERHIVELKIWRGESYRQNGIEELKRYMDSQHEKKSYMVSFCFNKHNDFTEYTRKWLELDGDKSIYEVEV